MRILSGLVSAAWLVLLPVVATAQTQPNTKPTVAEVLAAAPEAAGLFVARDDDTALHVPSGMICPRAFGSVNIWHVLIYAADGSDVGCDYGRNGPDNRWTTKLTIYAVRAQPGDTVDIAFARYRNEVKSTYPQAKETGPAITFDGDQPPDVLKNVRSEEYEFPVDGKAAVSDLVVTIRDGWIIEIRTTVKTEVPNTDEAAQAVSDLALPAMALMQATSTIGKRS